MHSRALTVIVYWSSRVHQQATGSLFQSVLPYRATGDVVSEFGICRTGCHSRQSDNDHSYIPGTGRSESWVVNFAANSISASLANHQVVILSTNQAETYFQNISRADLHSMGELASHDRDCGGDRGLQRCKLRFLVRPIFFVTKNLCLFF